MPTVITTRDTKPTNLTVVNNRPNNRMVQDIKSKNLSPTIYQVGAVTSFARILSAGQPIGLLLSLTYPVAGTVTGFI